MRRYESELALGHTLLECNGLKGRPVVALNYVNPNHQFVLPYPNGDWYLVNTAVAAVRSGETVVASRLIDGLVDYYRDLQLIPDDAQIIEVEPQLDQEVRYGFPATDPLQSLTGQIQLNGDKPLIATPIFTGSVVDQQQKQLGLCSVTRPDSLITNNKARLRSFSSSYKYRMLPGECISRHTSIPDLADRYSSYPHGVWLKFPTGSGGDLVRHVREVTTDGIAAVIEDLRLTVARSFDQGQFTVQAEQFWPGQDIHPQGLPLVLEVDAQNLGEVVVNGSSQVATYKNGKVALVGHFRQITTETGEYLGNRPLYIENSDLVADIESQVAGVARFSQFTNRYFGLQGIDWFVVKRHDTGRDAAYVVELNSRPTANTPPLIMANKLGAGDWINTNVYTNRPVSTIDDFVAVVGSDLAYGNLSDGMIIPQSFRTLVTRQRIIPSPDFKSLILGADGTVCDNVVARLQARGVRFNPS